MSLELTERVIEVNNLKTYFYLDIGVVKAVDGVDFSVDRGKTLGIIGESGCGKSVTVHTIMRLIQSPPGKIVDGSIKLYRFRNNELEVVDITKLDPKGKEMRNIRGKEIGMVFQEPMTAFSPMYTIGDQIVEAILTHENIDKKKARERAIEFLRRVGIPRPERTIDAYPFQLSGGMRQRAMIAMALSCYPRLLIADEPTTAVDVTVQAQILDLLQELQEEMKLAIIFITHNLAVVSEIADDIAVMYLGKIVEFGKKEEIFNHPLHPYTVALFRSIPKVEGKLERLVPIYGNVPSSYQIPEGCSFHPRCESAIRGICNVTLPDLIDVGNGHKVRCLIYQKVEV
ncbi:MAG: ABC transporter ATP-binding protein [bacterium]|nr:ABC transporter ATP-binding protein [bacterium]